MYTSVSSYSFSQYLNDKRMTLFDCVEKAAQMGFSAIEFIDLPTDCGMTEEEFAAKLAEKAKECGIKISAYTIGASLIKDTDEETRAEIERVKRKVDVAKILGAPVMRHDAYFAQNKYRTFELALPELAQNIREITDYAEKLGIKTMVENHGYICQDSARVEQIVTAVNHKNFGLLVDMGNFMCVDEVPYLAVSRVAPYAFHVHAKDFSKYPYHKKPLAPSISSRGCSNLVATVCGMGDVDVENCLAILKRAGYDGCVTLEYEGAIDCIAAIEMGLKNINEAIKRIG